MPIILKENETQPTEMFEMIQQTGYPPIFAQNLWMKGVLYKDVQQFFKPTECIGKEFLCKILFFENYMYIILGSTYTPGAQKLRLENLLKRKQVELPNIWDSKGIKVE